MTIVGILAAILLPAISRSKEVALRVNCASNLRQFGIANAQYAYYNKNYLIQGLPPSFTSFNYSVFVRGTYDLRNIAKGYVSNWRIYTCPAIGAVPIDDPRNTRSPSYSVFVHYPGTTGPFYNIAGKAAAPHKAELARDPSGTVMTQDLFTDWTAYTGGGVAPPYMGNHSREPFFYGATGLLNNPSNNARYAGLGQRSLIDGANNLFYDGHAYFLPEKLCAKLGPAGNGTPAQTGSIIGYNSP